MILEIATTTLELGGGELSPLAELAEGEQILPDKALSKSLEARDFNDIGYNLDKDRTPIERLSKNEAVLSDRELSKSVEGYSKTLPRTGGEWSGEVGNSMWKPDKDYIPENRNYSNPDGKSAGELFQKHGIDGIQFNNGEPNFSEISEGTVEIENFSDCRYGLGGNFDQADEKLSIERNCSKQEIKEWRMDNQYTWHERSDCQTMDLVPRDIHNWLPHSGGISEIKKTQ